MEWPDRLEKEPAAALGVEIRLDGACRRVTVDASALDGDHPWRAATESAPRGRALLGPLTMRSGASAPPPPSIAPWASSFC